MNSANKIDYWNEKFLANEWGRYPPEELVQFIGRNFKHGDRSCVEILEVGCGPGANVWFLHREGYAVSGIDGSMAAIDQAKQRLAKENAGYSPADLRVGNFSLLPWPDNSFDVVIDVFAIYANDSATISRTHAEVLRVLKPGGVFFSKMWGTQTSGFGLGQRIEDHTFENIPDGPCHNMGQTHFFDEIEIKERLRGFQTVTIDRILRTSDKTDNVVEELVCQATKRL
ncbi:MAG: class I SAM-dependent methyltransferase [Deltaproteobacteria bacterium]|nr:class I SAM-dependent methyltransferase [Deltaproteobacteria bacterium]MBI3295904.1 class I SAM-dependent methyltransferase [Deltaproteobacteria bacterium]